MILQIDFKSGTPVYLQLADQVRYGAASGALRPGELLPPIRPLAEQLHLNRNTVAKAYSELEGLGVIETIPGKGCFVKETNSPFTQQVRQKLLTAKIDEAIVTAHQLQVDLAGFLALAAKRVEFFERKTARTTPAKQETPPEEQPLTPTTPSPPSASSAGPLESWTPLTD